MYVELIQNVMGIKYPSKNVSFYNLYNYTWNITFTICMRENIDCLKYYSFSTKRNVGLSSENSLPCIVNDNTYIH